MQNKPQVNNLPVSGDTGFFGRHSELEVIETAFSVGEGENPTARRIAVVGIAGQGKSELVAESARRQLASGRFDRAVRVDFANLNIEDMRGLAVSRIAAVLQKTLRTAFEVAHELAQAPTLLILDNIDCAKGQGLAELLDAAKVWSEAQGCCVLLTSEHEEFDHPDFPAGGNSDYQQLHLAGLASRTNPKDALDWFAALRKASKGGDEALEQEALIGLLDSLAFHPLAIAVLAQHLSADNMPETAERLQQLLSQSAGQSVAPGSAPPSLVAVLRLSLESMPSADRDALLRLGVCAAGVMEDSLFAVAGLGLQGIDAERDRIQRQLAIWDSNDPRAILAMIGEEVPDDAELSPDTLDELKSHPQLNEQIDKLRKQLAEMPPADTSSGHDWPRLRGWLAATRLMREEPVLGANSPFLRFHQSLLPLLWSMLDQEQQGELIQTHRERYSRVARFLFHQDRNYPDQARAIAECELPNLLKAVHNALDAGDEQVNTFVNQLKVFLKYFGLSRESKAITERLEQAGEAPGSEGWVEAQSQKGRQLFADGQVGRALEIFMQVREVLDDSSPEVLASTLGWIGRSLTIGGRADLAESELREAITLTRSMPSQGEEVQRLRAWLHQGLGDALFEQGGLPKAASQYQMSLETFEKQSDLEKQGELVQQLGVVSMREGDLQKAVMRLQDAVALTERVGEPRAMAFAHRQLAEAYDAGKDWHQAEHHYEKAVGLFRKADEQTAIAACYDNLFRICKHFGRMEAAENWIRSAMSIAESSGDQVALAQRLDSFAELLLTRSGRLEQAREVAEKALSIKQGLEPLVAAMWVTCDILARIADAESQPEQAADWRHKARVAKRAHPDTVDEVKQFAREINAVVNGQQNDAEAASAADQWQRQLERAGGDAAALADAIQALREGERDPDILFRGLGPSSSVIIETLLEALENPDSLQALEAG